MSRCVTAPPYPQILGARNLQIADRRGPLPSGAVLVSALPGVTADRQDKAVRSMAIQGVAKALTRQIRATGDRLYKKDDARARHNGWTIETRRGGLARTYRD